MKNRLFHRLAAFVMAGAMVVSLAAVPAAATEVEPHEHTYGEDNICTICNQTRPELVREDLDTTKTAENTGMDVSTDNGGNTETDTGTGNGGNTGTGDGTDNGGNTGTDTDTDNNGNSENTENTQDTEDAEETEADKSEGTEGESLTEEEKAAQESAKRVAEVQALIDALRTEFPEEEWEAEKARYDAVTAALATLTEEEKAQLDLTKYQALGELIQSLPMTLEEKAGTVTTEQELRDAIAQGGDVVLANDITIHDTALNITKDTTLDLATHTITYERSDSSQIRDSIQVTAAVKVSIINGKLINNAAPVGKKAGRCIDITAGATVNLDGVTMETSGGGNTQPVLITDGAAGASVTLNGCTVNTVSAGYAVDVFVPNCSVNINNSTLNGYAAVWARGNAGGTVFNITNSTLTGLNNSASGTSSNFATFPIDAPVTINISGGEIRNIATSGSEQYMFSILKEVVGATVNAVNTKVTVEGENAYLTDTQGYTYEQITANTIKLPDSCKEQLAKETLKLVDGKVVPMINSEERLRAAVAAGDDVTLDADIELSQPLVIANGKTVTLDLNGHTLRDGEGCLKEGGPDSLVVVDNGATLTVTDTGTAGKISSSMYGIKLTQDSTYGEGQNTAKLVVNGGTIEAQIFAITGNGRRHNTDITINGGAIIGTGAGIYQPQNGKLTINGGTVNGGTGVEIRSGTLTVTGGVIASTEKEFKIEENGNKNGSTTTGAAVAVVPHITNFDVKVTIENGTLTAPHALHEENVQNSTGKITMAVSNGKFEGVVEAKDVGGFVTGGSFTVQPDEKLATEHFSFEKKPDGSFGLKEDPYIIDGEGNKVYPTDPDAPVSLDQMLENNAQKDNAKITLGANGVVDKAYTMTGKLTMEVNGHKITGTGSISGELTLKNLNAKGTHLALPQGGKVTFQNGSVQVTADAVTNAAGNSVGYSKPIQITYGGHVYTYFLGLGGSNDGKLTIDANGKPTVTGQHYVVKDKVDKIKSFIITGVYNGDVRNNDFYKNTNSTLQFVSDAPATALQTSYVTVDGKQITDSSYFSVTSGDTAAVTLSNKYLRSLSVGVHTLHMNFLDGSTAFAVFSVRTTSNADLSNPKTGDTIFLPIAVMTLSLTALAVLMPRKKKFF